MHSDIYSFWVGDDISFIEYLIMKSYVDHGHNFTLYTLGDVDPIPAGVTVQSALEILTPIRDLGPGMRHNNAVYSDLFRLTRNHQLGGIWVDMDACCLRPFDFENDFVVAFDSQHIANGVLGLPQQSATLENCIQIIENKGNIIPPFFTEAQQNFLKEKIDDGVSITFYELPWATSGPFLVEHFLRQTGEIEKIMPKRSFYPGPKPYRRPLLDPNYDHNWYAPSDVYSVHFYGRTKRILAMELDGIPPSGSFLEKLCNRHEVNPTQFPLKYTPQIPSPDVISFPKA